MKCADCGKEMVLRNKPAGWSGASSFVFLCEDYPQCRGLLSARPDGTPVGTPANVETRNARKMVHGIFDQIWNLYGISGQRKKRLRTAAYGWLAEQMGMTLKQCHIGKMDIEQLRQVWRIIKRDRPDWRTVEKWFSKKQEEKEDASLLCGFEDNVRNDL